MDLLIKLLKHYDNGQKQGQQGKKIQPDNFCPNLFSRNKSQFENWRPAFGEGRERIYLVELTGEIEDDPDLTDRKFPGNPTKSYRSTEPFRVVGEVTVWQGHSAEQVKSMKEAVEKRREQGINSLND